MRGRLAHIKLIALRKNIERKQAMLHFEPKILRPLSRAEQRKLRPYVATATIA
jgi:hypothetical protein